MYTVVKKRELNPTVTLMEIKAPFIAAKAQPGQFLILRAGEDDERVPFAIAKYNRAAGTVSIIFRAVGATTEKLSRLNEGDSLADVVGPLGTVTKTHGIKKACIVTGGVGSAIALPIVRKLHEQDAEVTLIVGFRSKENIILVDEFRDSSDKLYPMTDDGSYGLYGNVCVQLKKLIDEGQRFDMIFAVGPLAMMKNVVDMARPTGIPCTVSMNPIMIDGTGMCGGCRLSLHRDGRTIQSFACVEGPEYNGYEVDFDEAIFRSRMYLREEAEAREATCNLFKKAVE